MVFLFSYCNLCLYLRSQILFMVSQIVSMYSNFECIFGTIGLYASINNVNCMLVFYRRSALESFRGISAKCPKNFSGHFSKVP
jgi:hypothetical protein